VSTFNYLRLRKSTLQSESHFAHRHCATIPAGLTPSALDAADRVTLMEKLTSGAISAMESLRDSGALTG
jgi:hypothetical protein